jgi:hypothetical integral membrane protein (TIGR02206 family)
VESFVLWLKDGELHDFALFDRSHLVVLLLLLLLCGSFLLLRGPRAAAARTAFRFTAAFLLIGTEVLLHVWAFCRGQWTVQTMLPLQLCSVSQYLAVVMLLTRSRRLYEYVYFLGLGGAIPALLTPDIFGYGFPHFRFFEYFVSHGMIVAAALFMTLAEGYRPRWRSVVHVIVAVNVYMAAVGVFNYFMGSNYLFLAGKPAGETLYDLLGPWPWYLLSVEVLGVLVVLLLYAPFAVRDWRRRRPARESLDLTAPSASEGCLVSPGGNGS